MIYVYLVNGVTRLHLPNSQHSMGIRQRLEVAGHTIELVDVGLDVEDDRSEEEVQAAMLLIDSVS